MAARQMRWQQQQQGRFDGKFDWFLLGFSCGFLLDFSYGFSVGFSFYWFWFGLGMSFRRVWVAVVIVRLCWVGGWKIVFFFFAELLWSLGKRGNPRERERERENKISNTRATITVYICMITIARCINTQFYTHWCGCFFGQNV